MFHEFLGEKATAFSRIHQFAAVPNGPKRMSELPETPHAGKLPFNRLSEPLDGEEKLYSADLMFSTDENILYEDLKTQIDAALSKLSPRSREIFLLSRFDGMKNKEIAELLGISTTAVEKHISKSLKVISDYLKDNSSYYQYIVIMSFFLFTK